MTIYKYTKHCQSSHRQSKCNTLRETGLELDIKINIKYTQKIKVHIINSEHFLLSFGARKGS